MNTWKEWPLLRRIIVGRADGTIVQAEKSAIYHDWPEPGLPPDLFSPLSAEMVDTTNEQLDNLARKGMKQFHAPSNIIAVAAVALDYLMIFTFAGAAIYLDHWAVTLCAIVLIAGRQVAFSNLVHAAAHHALFRSKSWNNSIEFFASYLILDSIATNREPHLEHHAKFLKGCPERFEHLYGEFSLQGRGFSGRTWVTFIRPLLGYNGLDFLGGTVKSLRQHPSFALRLCLYWVALIGICYWLGGLNYFLLYWVLPLLWIYPMFDRWAQISDHFQVGVIARNHHGLFYGVFTKPHEAYHYTHHLYPSIPFYRLKAATRHLIREGREIESTSSFIDFVRIVYYGIPNLKGVTRDDQKHEQGQLTLSRSTERHSWIDNEVAIVAASAAAQHMES